MASYELKFCIMEATEGNVEGKEGEADGGPSVGLASGGERRKNKGGKKGKKGRR